MDKLKNKNTVILIISAVLILIAIIVAVVASTSAGKDKTQTTEKTTTEEAVSLDLEAIADLNNASTTKKAQQPSYSYELGKYKVATKDDPLGLRLEPNTSSDRLIYVPKGYEVEVLAVWEDWGYVVYEQTGGWLSMNYLELVSSSKNTKSTTSSAEQ